MSSNLSEPHPAQAGLDEAGLQALFDEGLAAFPYDLEPTSITQGTLEVAADDEVEYSEEHTFAVGQLLDEPLVAGGWIDLRRQDGEVTLTAFFGVARNGDFQDKDAQVLPEYTAIQGHYDLDTKRWELWIDQY